jgi:hypothetical protein
MNVYCIDIGNINHKYNSIPADNMGYVEMAVMCAVVVHT